MRNSTALIACFLFLEGCTHCQVATFYKPFAEVGNRSIAKSGSPTSTDITLGNVALTITVCGDHYLAPPKDTVALCIIFELDDATSLQFSEPTVNLGVGVLPPMAVPMAAVEYEILCRIKNGERICTSSEDSPVDGPIKKVPWKGASDRYSFSPALKLRGAKDTLHEGAWFGYRLTGKRQYSVRTLPITVPLGSELTVQLPNVILNDQVLTPTAIKFRAIKEEICRMVPLA